MVSEINQTLFFGLLAGLCFGASVFYYAHAICAQRRSWIPFVLKLPLLIFLFLAFKDSHQTLLWVLLVFVLGAGTFLSGAVLARKKRLG